MKRVVISDKAQGGKFFCVRSPNDGVTGAELLLHGSSSPTNICVTFFIDGFLRDSLRILSITMPHIPTPPASRPGSEAPEVEIKPAEVPGASTELLQSLDILLEQYLHLLDRQQELQSGLAKQLSSVYDSVV